jgi:hypothetical protein
MALVVKERWPCGLAVVSGGLRFKLTAGFHVVNTGG